MMKRNKGFMMWYKIVIVLNIICVIGGYATGNYLAVVENLGWIVLMYGFFKHDEFEDNKLCLSS